jgi:hypothetical protein
MKIIIDLENVIYRYFGKNSTFYSHEPFERILFLLDNSNDKLISIFENLYTNNISLTIIFKTYDCILFFNNEKNNINPRIIRQKRFSLEKIKYIHKNNLKSRIFHYSHTSLYSLVSIRL